METKKHIRDLIPALLVVGLVVAMGLKLGLQESELLFRAQEQSLFLPTRLFYETSCIYPGGTLTWMAAFLTQFFFHPALGVSLLCLAWLAICALTAWLWRLRGPWVLLTALLPLALLAIITQTGYWIYLMKLQGHLWVPTLGVLLALVLQIPASYVRGWWRMVYIALVGIAGYPLMGAWSFLALVLLATREYPDSRRSQAIAYVALALALLVFVPQVCYQWGYTQVQHNLVYRAALPSYQFGAADCSEFRLPFYALAVAFGLITLSRWQQKVSDRLTWVLGIACLVAAIMGVRSRWYRDTNFRKEVKMVNCIERLDWEGVLRTMKDNTMGEPMPPTRLMVMEKNLALFRLGRAGDEMFHYPEGAEQYCVCGRHHIYQTKADGLDTLIHLPVDKTISHPVTPTRITHVGGKLMYYFLGKEQFCYRWCMEDGVEFGWSVNVLKYMVKTSLVTHDWEVARKYLNLLKKTRYHKEWARHYEQFLHHPELMAEDPEFLPIIPMSQFPDRLDGDMTLMEMYLLKTFSSGHGADRYYQEATLICSIIMKDIELFWPRFRQYVNMHQRDEGFRVPTHYQEAAYLYSMLEPNRPSEMWPGMTNAEAAQRIPFDSNVKQRYQDFMNFNTQCGSMTEEQKKRAFYPQFGDTFYYFYFLVRNQKTN